MPNGMPAASRMFIDNVILTTVLGSMPAHGALTLNANGAFSYVPSPGSSGPDAFSYAAKALLCILSASFNFPIE